MSDLLTATASTPTALGGAAATSAELQSRDVRARDLPVPVKVAAALVAVYLLTLLFGAGADVAAAMTNLSFALFPALAATACWSGARSLPLAQRPTWRLVAVAMTLYAAGGLVWLTYTVRGLPVPVPSLGELGFLGYVLPLTAALLVLPTARQGWVARAEIVLDCAVIFSSLLFCAWLLVLEPLRSVTAGLPRAQVLTLYAYPAVDILIIAAALATLMRVRSREIRSWLSLLTGLLLVAVADLIYVSLVARNAYDAAAPYNVMWAMAFLLIALAPHLGGLSHPAGERLTVVRALVPYGALAATVGVGLGERIHPSENLPVFVLAVVVLVAATTRQVLVVVVKTRLADHLEDQVASATGELRAEREFLTAVLDNLHAGVIACDRDGRITLYNSATAQFHSDPKLSRVNQWHTDLRNADGTGLIPLEDNPLMHALAGERVQDVDFMIIPPHAPALAVTASGRALRGADGEIVGAVVAMHDVTERRRQQHTLERKAAHDDLTGLGNRGAFKAEISRRLAADLPVAVMLIDLDDFKHINDSLGHDTGDQCLIAVARRLVQALPDRGSAYRLGGDEFVIVFDPDVLAPEACAQATLAAIAAPVQLGGVDLSTTASIGVAVRGSHCESARELLQAADLAMYVAKSGGKSCVSTYQDHMRGEAQSRLTLEADLRKAISNGELHLQYQPIVDVSSGRMSAVEALVRWNHPDRGAISPVEFIPIAEQCGLIVPLGEWVLQQASAQLLTWDALGGDEGFRVTVNISTRQLERPGLLDALDRCLDAGVHPSRLVLEVTETALTLDGGTALQTMHAIRARGVQLAVDDFGTGYSSLSRLRSAPISRIKIDRSFVSEIVEEDANVPIVEATMAMARGLGMGIIAEGVETPEQLTYLIRSGCPEAQGYLFSRPVDADSILTCMTNPPWSQMLAAPSPKVVPSGTFLRLVELAVDPDVSLEQLVRPLLIDLHETTGLAMTYLTRVQTQVDTQELTFVQSVTAGPVHEGLIVPWSESLCKRALEHGPRSTSNPVGDFNDTAVARQLGLAAYVVEPVHGPDGQLYGTLCGASTQSHVLHEHDSANLRMYARLIEQKLESGAEAAAARPTSASLTVRRQRVEQLWQDTIQNLLTTSASPAEMEQRSHHIAIADRAWNAQRSVLQVRGDDSNRRLRVVIADDQQLLREVLAAIIAGEENLRLVGIADSAWSTVGVIAAEQPDILVLDYELGDATASDVIEHIRTLSPGTRILLHSSRSDIHQLGQHMQVDRVVHKGDDAARLPEALRTLAT